MWRQQRQQQKQKYESAAKKAGKMLKAKRQKYSGCVFVGGYECASVQSGGKEKDGCTDTKSVKTEAAAATTTGAARTANGKHKQMSLNNFYESDKSELYEWTQDTAASFSNAIYLC